MVCVGAHPVQNSNLPTNATSMTGALFRQKISFFSTACMAATRKTTDVLIVHTPRNLMKRWIQTIRLFCLFWILALLPVIKILDLTTIDIMTFSFQKNTLNRLWNLDTISRPTQWINPEIPMSSNNFSKEKRKKISFVLLSNMDMTLELELLTKRFSEMGLSTKYYLFIDKMRKLYKILYLFIIYHFSILVIRHF